MRLLIASLLLTASVTAGAQPQAPKEATAATRALQQATLARLPLADRSAFDDARRGFVAPLPEAIPGGAGGRPAWTLRGYEFLAREQAPDSVNPALWRHAQLNMVTGLFKVHERLWQLRGLDISNMTIIEGDSGLIVIDPLLTAEVARAGLELYFQHRPRKPVLAVIYSHSHADHFGGVRGVVDEQRLAAGQVVVIAPHGFMEEAVSENVLAGNAMSRRALYQFGPLLPRGERGQVDAGLGKTVSTGSVTLIAPTQLISKPVETHRIDGVEIVFELTPGAEAPAEMIMYYPQLRVLNMAEIASQNMHNLLPIRGAQVRDALSWSKYLGGALHRYGSRSDVLVMQHHWPVWGGERLQQFLRTQRDTYKYVHDQTVRWMNHGYTGPEIAEMMTLPPSLAGTWSSMSFYGHTKHNVRAVYQRYLGYYDGNPANLEALPPVAAAQKTIAYMGGPAAVLERLRADFARGEYRWVAQTASTLVFAEPANAEAKALAADAYEQLGYQMESATARNAFLQGAFDLRNGPARMPIGSTAAADVIRALPLEMFFDFLGVRLDAAKAQGRRITLNWRFTDVNEQYLLTLDNSALSHLPGVQSEQADATVVMTRATLGDIALQKTSFPQAMQSGDIVVHGRTIALMQLLQMIETYPTTFPLVEPRPAR